MSPCNPTRHQLNQGEEERGRGRKGGTVFRVRVRRYIAETTRIISRATRGARLQRTGVRKGTGGGGVKRRRPRGAVIYTRSAPNDAKRLRARPGVLAHRFPPRTTPLASRPCHLPPSALSPRLDLCHLRIKGACAAAYAAQFSPLPNDP